MRYLFLIILAALACNIQAQSYNIEQELQSCVISNCNSDYVCIQGVGAIVTCVEDQCKGSKDISCYQNYNTCLKNQPVNVGNTFTTCVNQFVSSYLKSGSPLILGTILLSILYLLI
ncbi:hypothetical protein TTHERM_00096680 (macronuclear) [Tetrahymena thermophila SB210]|uniref:Transmembrane protein n=1 Tax=Tetrahymena thermophila (strain SB210) TaxID=312017 RepID=Q234Y0_TETTS|nr:hypothetical protein TTHERM_00096680 [Tetrahymena thermophila SB210]EAR91873.1 hypothetical protein TTHERM_00096680 [Tetrahymena thermophila SB210]|eukprot:XP_001012118.1 hypothetical protein TTHERM_00096680 [Tetrahymena thermophila SB210]